MAMLLGLAPTVAVIGIASALWLMGAPHILIVSPDSYGYLGPSLSALSGGDFTHVYSRGFVYPALIYASLRAFGTLSGLIYVQAACYLLTLIMLVAMLWLYRAGPVITGTLSFLLAVVFLIYAPLLDLTQALGPEAFWSFLAVLSAFALIVAHRAQAGSTFAIMMVVAVYASWANVLVKPQWLLAAIFLTAVWAAVLIGARFRAKVSLLVVTGSLVAITLLLPELYLAEKYDARSSALFAPKTLFCNHADIIIRAEHDHPGLLPAEILGDLEGTTAVKTWPLLGFSGDACMYGTNPEMHVVERFGNDVAAMRAFYVSSFLAAVRTEPGAYLRKIGRQMVFVMVQPIPNADLELVARDGDMTERSRYPGLERIYPPTAGTVKGFAVPIRSVATVVRVLIESPLWLPGIGLAVALAMMLTRRWAPLFPITVLTGAWLAQALTVAASHSFDVTRYRWMAPPLLIGAAFLAAQWALDVEAYRPRIRALMKASFSGIRSRTSLM